MPRKDPDAKLAYQREWYARPGNRERVIASVYNRKRTLYAGTCRNCGGPTIGGTKGAASEWCNKPECASAQRKHLWAERNQGKALKAKQKRSPVVAKKQAEAPPSKPEVSRYFRPRKKAKP